MNGRANGRKIDLLALGTLCAPFLVTKVIETLKNKQVRGRLWTPIVQENIRTVNISISRVLLTLKRRRYVSIKENAALRFLLAEGLVYAETNGTQDKLTSTGQLNIFCAAPILRSLILSEIQSPPTNISVDEVPDRDIIDPRWLLAHMIEVSLGQNYFRWIQP